MHKTIKPFVSGGIVPDTLNMNRFLIIPLIVLAFCLSACSSPQNYMEAKGITDSGPLTPLPSALLPVDPNNGQFMTAITDYIQSVGAPTNSRYEFTRIDLDNDGRREGLVIFRSPHSSWCDINGCQMLVLKAHDDYFTKLAEVKPVRGPLVVSDQNTNGYRDIIVRVSGRSGWDAKNIRLAYDGRTYPENPAFQSPIRTAMTEIPGTRIFP